MASLRDIKRAAGTVDLGGGVKIEITGIAADDLETLWHRFPELGKMMNGVGLDVEKLVHTLPAAAAAIIATAMGNGGDAEEEDFARKNLVIGAQIDLICEIVELTFPKGLGPLQRLAAKFGGVPASAGADAPRKPSPKA